LISLEIREVWKALFSMKLADIEAELPNGFHDAKLIAIHRNLSDEITTLDIEVLIGLPDEEVENRDRYRSATLNFKETKIVVIDPPGIESSFKFPGAATIVITEDEAGSLPAELLAKVSDKHHTYTIFVQDWLSNIRIAAADLEFKWR
jgi:hypothetical protein